jgi:hypothetical protein
MSYPDAEVSEAIAAMQKYRARDEGEVGAALIVVGLSAERAAMEIQIRDDMIRVAHRAARERCRPSHEWVRAGRSEPGVVEVLVAERGPSWSDRRTSPATPRRVEG